MTLKRPRHGRENERPGSAPQPRPGLHLEGLRSHGRKSRRGPAGYDPSSLRFRADCAARGTSATRSCGRIINRVHRTGELRPRRMALGAPGRRPPNPRARLHRPRRSRRPRTASAAHAQAPATSAKTKPAAGDPRRPEGSPAARALRDPRCHPLLSPPRRHLLAPAQRVPANRRQRVRPSLRTLSTHYATRSRTSAAADPGQPTPSGAPHAQNKPNAKR